MMLGFNYQKDIRLKPYDIKVPIWEVAFSRNSVLHACSFLSPGYDVFLKEEFEYVNQCGMLCSRNFLVADGRFSGYRRAMWSPRFIAHSSPKLALRPDTGSHGRLNALANPKA